MMVTKLRYFVEPSSFAELFRELIKNGRELILESRLQKEEDSTKLESVADAEINQRLMQAIENPRHYDMDINSYIVDYLQSHKVFLNFFLNYLGKGNILIKDSRAELPRLPFDIENSVWSPVINVPKSYEIFVTNIKSYFFDKQVHGRKGVFFVKNVKAREFYNLANYFGLIE